MPVARLEGQRGGRHALGVDDGRRSAPGGPERRPAPRVRRLAGGRPGSVQADRRRAAAAGRRRSCPVSTRRPAAEAPLRAGPASAEGRPAAPSRRVVDGRVELGDRVGIAGRARPVARPRACGPPRRGRRAGPRTLGAAARSGSPSTEVTRRASASARSWAPCGSSASAHGSANSAGSSTAARRRCATAGRCSTGAAARRGTTCPGRGARPRPRRTRRRSRSASAGQRTLLGAVGLGVPLLADHVVAGHERGLAAHGEPDVAAVQPRVDRLAERVDAGPLRVGVGRGDPRVLVDAGDLVDEAERDLDRLGRALDRRGAARVRGGAQRDVALAGEQRTGRVHADPSGTGEVDLGPRVQVGEVLRRSGRAVARLGHVGVGGELDEVAGDEPRGQAVLPEQGDEQPRAVAARPDPAGQRLVGRLDAGLHPDVVGDVPVHRGVEVGGGTAPSGAPPARRSGSAARHAAVASLSSTGRRYGARSAARVGS